MSQPAAQPAADVWTVGRIIDWTTGHLKKHGSDTPRLDTEILLAHVRKCPRIQLYVQYNEPLSPDERTLMRELVQRRAKSEPVAYLVGRREFYGLDFRVTPDVLVPRPETETLVMELLTAAKGRPNLRILDVGTGSGCIAITAAVHLKDASITAIDLYPAALAVARGNAQRHNVTDRIRFLEGDLFHPLPEGLTFDFIVSNPPYVSDSDMERLPPDVRLHEPRHALRAGPMGLDVIERLVTGAGTRLAANGLLLLEFSPEQVSAVTQLLETAAFREIRVTNDPAGLPRVSQSAAG